MVQVLRVNPLHNDAGIHGVLLEAAGKDSIGPVPTGQKSEDTAAANLDILVLRGQLFDGHPESVPACRPILTCPQKRSRRSGNGYY
jgi:hypothetical protein